MTDLIKQLLLLSRGGEAGQRRFQFDNVFADAVLRTVAEGRRAGESASDLKLLKRSAQSKYPILVVAFRANTCPTFLSGLIELTQCERREPEAVSDWQLREPLSTRRAEGSKHSPERALGSRFASVFPRECLCLDRWNKDDSIL